MPEQVMTPGPAAGAGTGRLPTVPPLRGAPEPGRCLVMAVLTVTPDLFSDESRSFRPALAVARGLELLRQGADIIDVGGESARPGAAGLPLAEERRRVVPVIRELCTAGAFVSVDTTRARVAEAAVEAGARMVSDVSGGTADPAMLRFVAACGVPYVITQWRGTGSAGRPGAASRSVVAEVLAHLASRVSSATQAGIRFDRLVLDPGVGGAATDEHNWQLLAHLGEFRQLGRPVLVSPSRKSFPGPALRRLAGTQRQPADRDAGSAAVAALAAETGAWGVRAHDAESTRDAVRVVAAVRAQSRQPAPSALPRPAVAARAPGGLPVHI